MFGALGSTSGNSFMRPVLFGNVFLAPTRCDLEGRTAHAQFNLWLHACALTYIPRAPLAKC